MMRVAVAQIDCVPGDVNRNAEQMIGLTKQAATGGHHIVLFPEMSDVGYDMPVVVETATDWETGAFPQLADAARRGEIWIVAGLAERSGADIYNTLAVIRPDGQLAAKYRKVHLITAAPMCEHEYLKPGKELVLCDLEGFRCGFMTCYDIRFPEVARGLTRLGAELLIAPAAFPLARIQHWRTITTCRAIENQAYLVAPNRIGSEGGVTFGGTSRVVGPYGTLIGELSETESGLLTAEIDLAPVREFRTQLRALEDRREDLYRDWSA